MSDIEGLRHSLICALDEEERTREEAFSMSRELIRSSRKIISELVLERNVDMSALREDVKMILDKIERGRSRFAFVEDALAEYCEVEVLRSMLKDEGIPPPDRLGVPERAFVLGVCDAVGEMRRVTLNRLLRGDLDGAVTSYEKMKEIGHLIEGLVYPSGMIPLKKKQDVVRSLLDRTGGELAVAVHSSNRLGYEFRGLDDG